MQITEITRLNLEQEVLSRDGNSPEIKFALETVLELAINDFAVEMLPMFHTPLFFETSNAIADYLMKESISLNVVESLSDEINHLVLVVFYASIIPQNLTGVKHPYLPLGVIECAVQLFIEATPMLANYISLTHLIEISQIMYKKEINWHIIFA